MFPVRSLAYNLREYSLKHKALYALSSMLLFFAIFDSVLGYALPILLTSNGFTKTEMGLILGFSSVAGALFDVLLGKIIKDTSYQKMFLLMLAGCALYFGALTMSPSLFVYLFAMAVWGLYWNFLTYGLYNFVSTHEKVSDHASSWGVLDIFKGVGLVVAPIIASLAIGDRIGTPLYITAFIFLIIVYFFYLLILKFGGTYKKKEAKEAKLKNGKSLKIWFLVLRSLFPVFILNILLCVYDLSFATVGPLISENLGKQNHLGGAFLTLYYLPTILVLWLVGPITKKYGKKRTSFLGFIIGGILTGVMAFFGSSLIILPIILMSSLISSLAWPSLKGAFADYISKTPQYERQIEILTDFTGNIGCIIGPTVAGFAADTFGNVNALSFIGVACSVVAFVVFLFTPKKLRVSAQN